MADAQESLNSYDWHVQCFHTGGDAAAQSPWLPDGLQPEDNDLSFLSLLV